jgi:cell division protein FtsZ
MAKRKKGKKPPKKSSSKKTPKKIVGSLPEIRKARAKKIKIRVVGIGGGGSSIVSELASRMEKVSFVVANTDLQTLKTTGKKPLRFHFGKEITKGWGTGMNPELGKQAAQQEREKIKKLLEDFDLCILVASLGGGTGSGAAPVFAKISKKLGNITYGIFTLPFKFEGEKKIGIARKALRRLKPKVDIFSVIPNERIFKIIDKKTPLKKALSTINKNLAESLKGLIEIIYQPALINIDFADFKTILSRSNLASGKKRRRGGKLAYLNSVKVPRKKKGVKVLVEKALNNPLYSYSIRGAKGVLLNIAGERNLSLTEISQISKTISELVNKEAKIIFGVSESRKYKGTIQTTLLATGLPARIFLSRPRKKSIKKKRTKKKTKKKAKKKAKKRISPPKRRKPKKISSKKAKRRKKHKIKIKIGKPKIFFSQKKSISQKKKEKISSSPEKPIEEKIRKNGLQIKREMEVEEEAMLAREKFWETPSFLRKKQAGEK